MELKPEIGIDNLKFGMKRTQVVKILGKPDRIKFEEEDKNIVWEYFSYNLRLLFYQKENNKLGYIYTSNPKLTFNKKKIINSQIEFVRNKVFEKLTNDWELDDYFSFCTYFNEKYWISLNVEYGKVKNLEIGVPFLDSEKYKWPNK